MEELVPSGLPTWTHIISVLTGGVAFKYFDKWLSFKKESNSQHMDESKMIIDSLMRQIETLGMRITTLESERTALHERELIMARNLSAAEMKAVMLEERVTNLQRNQERLVELIESYEKKFGKL